MLKLEGFKFEMGHEFEELGYQSNKNFRYQYNSYLVFKLTYLDAF